MVRVVVAVDPSGADDADNADNDEIGIVVVGLGQDGAAYLLEDCTLKAGPATWGRVAVQAFMRHQADAIVGETNFGGAMVQQTVAVAARSREEFLGLSEQIALLRAEHRDLDDVIDRLLEKSEPSEAAIALERRRRLLILALGLVTFVPQFSLWLPSMFMVVR